MMQSYWFGDVADGKCRPFSGDAPARAERVLTISTDLARFVPPDWRQAVDCGICSDRRGYISLLREVCSLLAERRIAEELSRRLIELASRRVRTERLAEWRQAFDESGAGSTYRRANLIAERVYDRAAPIPDVTPSPDRNAFLEDVANAIKQSAEAVGAHLR